jgi:hypothetical protein
MDVLVRLEHGRTDSPVLAHVNSLPALPFGTRSRREVVTLYGAADAYSLALALAATVESERIENTQHGVVRHLGVWSDRGALGDSAWRDPAGKLVTRDVDIPLSTLELRAAELLGENGPTFRRVAAGLSMPDWPEGTDRALSFSFSSLYATAASGGCANTLDDAGAEHWLDTVRAADAFAFEMEGE